LDQLARAYGRPASRALPVGLGDYQVVPPENSYLLSRKDLGRTLQVC
jgi:hypothetical protein